MVMSKLKFRLSEIVVFLLFSPGQALATSRIIPVEPFHIRYEKAADILYGEILAIEQVQTDISVDDFKELPIKDLKLIKLKISKSWKGRKKGNIEFFAYSPALTPKREKWKLKSGPYIVGKNHFVYLRELDGKKVSETFFGFIPFWNDENPNDFAEIRALNDLANGKTMAEVVKGLKRFDADAHEDSRKNSK